MKGVDVLIQIEATTPGTYVTVGGQRGATLSESSETIDVTSKDSAGNYEYEYGLFGWTVSCDGIYIDNEANYIKLRDAMKNKTKVKVQVKIGTGTAVRKGDALVISSELDAPYDGEVTYSLELQGTGALATV